MLNALAVSLAGCSEPGWRRAAQSFQQQGFVPAAGFNWPNGMLHAWAHPAQRDVLDCRAQTGNGIACCVGPLWYRSRFGADALHKLLGDVTSSGRYDEMELRGNFALFLHTADCALLLNDPLGFVRVYVSADQCFYSTSWLATCAYMGCPDLDEAAAVEYVLLGAAHSQRTPARGVTILPLGRIFDFGTKHLQVRFPTGMLSGLRRFASLDEAMDVAQAHLRKVFTEITEAFPGRVNAALSGGFDSRLIVAGLLAAGMPPRLFVYGDTESADVHIAQQVARSANIPLRVINKSILNAGLTLPDIECLERSTLFFDGLPNDGIYDPGADRQTRLEQNSNGTIVLNGGGGEIFRNFFHLPGRRFRTEDVVHSFYRGFNPRVFRDDRGLDAFENRLAESICQSLVLAGSDVSEMLTRGQVELLYPLFRCHYWMSVNNSVAVRHGYYATPLVDLQTIGIACSLPLTWKNAGRFESFLVARLNHAVAKQLSSYGFRFSDGPDWRARLGEWLTCLRPITVRPYINALRRHLQSVRVTPEMISYCRRLLPGEWRLDPLLDLPRLPDNNALARALAVELVWRRLLV